MSRSYGLELFFGRDSPFSQHHRCVFRVDGRVFTSAEKYMMFRKAEVFNDEEIKQKVLNSDNPVDIKHYGREIKNFDIMIWMKHAVNVVKTANRAKFSQNSRLKTALVNTHPRELVEASPSDTRWGIGLSKTNPNAWNKAAWRGRNLLGGILTNVRDELMIEEELIDEPTIPEVPEDQTEVEKELKEREQKSERGHSKDRKKKFTFFYGENSPFSDNYLCDFTVRGNHFRCINQYMFYSKAEYFKDKRKMKEALSIRSLEELRNTNQKVKDYNGKDWYDASYDLYWEGIEAKYSQNEDLKKELLGSSPNVILEVRQSGRFEDKHWKLQQLAELREKMISDEGVQSRRDSYHSSQDLPKQCTITSRSDRSGASKSEIYSRKETKNDDSQDLSKPSTNTTRGDSSGASHSPKETKNYSVARNVFNQSNVRILYDRRKGESKNDGKKHKSKKEKKKGSERKVISTNSEDMLTEKKVPSDSVDFSDPILYEPDSIFSSTFRRKFEVDGKHFDCLDQYISYAKAELFGDENGKQNALAMEPPYRSQKVENFCHETWIKNKEDICMRGLEAKFSQHADLRSELVKSHPKAIFRKDKRTNDYQPKNHDDRFKRSFWTDFLLMKIREEYIRKERVQKQATGNRGPGAEDTQKETHKISSAERKENVEDPIHGDQEDYGADDPSQKGSSGQDSKDYGTRRPDNELMTSEPSSESNEQFGPELPAEMTVECGTESHIMPEEQYGPELPVEMMSKLATESKPESKEEYDSSLPVEDSDNVVGEGTRNTETSIAETSQDPTGRDFSASKSQEDPNSENSRQDSTDEPMNNGHALTDSTVAQTDRSTIDKGTANDCTSEEEYLEEGTSTNKLTLNESASKRKLEPTDSRNVRSKNM